MVKNKPWNYLKSDADVENSGCEKDLTVHHFFKTFFVSP
jgi:hypothetical protein